MSAPLQFNSEEFGEFGSWGLGFPMTALLKLLEVHGFNPSATGYYFALRLSDLSPTPGVALSQPIWVPAASEFSWVPYGTGWAANSNLAFFSWVVSSDPQVWVNPAVDFFVSGTVAAQFP